MLITFLGNFNVNFTTETHHLEAYRALGHTVKTLQEGLVSAKEVEESAMNSDLLVWTHTHGWNTPGMGEVLRKLKNKGIPSVGYHLDLWMGLKRELDLINDEYWGIEYFFTVDQGFVGKLKEMGVDAYFLPAGVNKRECYLGNKREGFEHDIIFVGSKRYHPEWPYRPKLVQWLENTYGNRFAHYGGDGLGVVRGKSLNNLYASSKIVIGDTLCLNFDYPYYLSDRIFETTGRGGFIIHPYIEGLAELFEINKEIVSYNFNDFDGLKTKIDYYLSNEELREQIRLAGMERTKKDHTYENRLQYLLHTIFG